MEHFSRHEETVETLLAEFKALKRLKAEMGKTENKRIDTWLQNVKTSKRDIDEINQEFTEINDIDRVLHPTDSSRRVNVNKKVIQSIKAVKALKETAVEMFLLAVIQSIPEDKLKRFSHDDLISFTSQPPQEIGSGGFGNVYKGQFANGVQVAIKILKTMVVIEEIFMSEMSAILMAPHPNIIQLYGFCSNANVKALVYEFMPKGSLDVVLFKNPWSVEWETVYGMAIEIAKALAHLHGAQIIHHDLKPSNVLLDPNNSPKITDFGTTRIVDEDMSHITITRTRGTRGYIAPEMCVYGSRVTYKCDVFSFGKVLFDILGMRSNTQSRHSLPDQVWDMFDKGELDVAIKDCGLEDYIEKARILSKVALWCIQFTPERRPYMTDVVSALKGDVIVAKPPNPHFACDNSGFSMLQYQDVIYSIVSPVTSNAQPHRTNPPARVSSENPNKLREDWGVFSKEMEALKKFRDEVALKKAQQMELWLEIVKSKEKKFGVLQNKFKKYIGGSLTVGHELNGQVLRILSSVNALHEVGNAVAHAPAFATSFTDLTFGNQRRFTHADIKSFRSNFWEVINSRGRDVFISQLSNGVKIVVKMKMDHHTDEVFINEMRSLLKASHPNVVKPYGFCFERNMKALVFEYMSKKSLDIILYQKKNQGIEWETLYNIAIETAKGLSYLHDGCDYQIIHGNVKASCVLLDQNFCPKISDFGRVMLLHENASHCTLSKARSDPNYAAPEIGTLLLLTAKCDVYSFGMLLFEVLGRQKNRINIQGQDYFPMLVWKLFENSKFEEIIQVCGITKKNTEKAMILCMVALWCIQYTPENRPSMTTVVKMLEEEIKVAMPPHPFVPSEPLVYDFD